VSVFSEHSVLYCMLCDGLKGQRSTISKHVVSLEFIILFKSFQMRHCSLPMSVFWILPSILAVRIQVLVVHYSELTIPS